MRTPGTRAVCTIVVLVVWLTGLVAPAGASRLSVRARNIALEADAQVEAVASSGATGGAWAVGQRGSQQTAWKLAPSGDVLAAYTLDPPGRVLNVRIAASSDGSLWVLSLTLPGEAVEINEGVVTLTHVTVGGAVRVEALTTQSGAQLRLQNAITGLTVATDGAAWFSTAAWTTSEEASRIDPGSGVVTSISSGTGKGVGGIAPGAGGLVWVDPSHPTPSLCEIDSSGKVVGRVALPGRAQVTSEIVSDGTALWLGARGYIARVTKRRLKTYRLPYGGAETIEALTGTAARGLWFVASHLYLGHLTARGKLAQINLPFLTPFTSAGPTLALGPANVLWAVDRHGHLYELSSR